MLSAEPTDLAVPVLVEEPVVWAVPVELAQPEVSELPLLWDCEVDVPPPTALEVPLDVPLLVEVLVEPPIEEELPVPALLPVVCALPLLLDSATPDDWDAPKDALLPLLDVWAVPLETPWLNEAESDAPQLLPTAALAP